MNISNGSKTRTHVFAGLVAVALLLTLCGVMRADDDQKKKNKQSAQSQPAATPKPAKTRNTGSGSGSGSGSGQGSGSGSGSSSGNPNKADRRFERQNNTTTYNSSGGTGTSGSTNSNKAERKLQRQTDSVGTGGGTGSGSGSGTGAGTGTSGKTFKNTGSNPTGGTGTSTGSGNPNSRVTTTSTTTASAAFVKSPNGKTEVFKARDGSEVHRSLDGRIREVHTRDMVITHYSGGYQRVVVERRDRSVVVVNRAGYGYVQRPFYWHNQPYYGRTYYYYGRPYAVYYRSYPYHGLFLPGYVPYRYYNPAFYGWAYNPWYRPIHYGWGWYGSPWYGYYGYYFTPYSVYPSPAFWLTDFLIASSLQLAYQERLQAQQQYYSQPVPSGQVVLTPEVKEAISDEVQRQLALERAESETVARGGEVDVNATGLPRIFADTSPNHPHVFVVASPLELTTSQGQECTLTQGDVLRLSYPPTGDATSAYLEVIASKNQECVRGTTVSVGLADLQEMENQMRTTIDRGLQDLQAHQGGLPAPPASAVGQGVQAPFAASAPPADQNISSELQQQAQQAQAAEQGVLTEAGQDDPDRGTSDVSSKQPIQIQVGQTIDEVRAALGSPSRIATVGSKQIYFYPDMKVTFIRGRVTDVE